MTAPLPGKARAPPRFGRALPYLALVAGLVLATAPAWRGMVFGFGLTIDDLLKVRCTPW